MHLAFSTQTGRGATKTLVDKVGDDGNIIARFSSTFLDASDFRKGGKALGVNADVLLDAVLNKFRKDGTTQVELSAARTGEVYAVRDEQGRTRTEYVSFTLALENCKQGQVIEWSSKDVTCALDIDYHKGNAPDAHDLLSFCECLNPTPEHYWITRSGGLRLIYQANGIYAASEFAACAALLFAQRFPTSKFELLRRTRAPFGRVHTRSVISCDMDAIRGLLVTYSDGDYTEWLEARGMEAGQRYPHSCCPVSPSSRAERNTPPVVVYSDHVHCYICAADGVKFGSRTPGYFPLSRLTGDRINTPIARCVDNFTHWGHAKHALRQAIANEEIAKASYAALLKFKHGDDPRIALVFTVGEPNGLVRYDGYWCDGNGQILTLSSSSAILRALPHCLKVSSGEMIESPESAEWLSECIDHSCRGYAALYPIRGIQFTQFQDLPTTRLFNVLPSYHLAREENISKRPRYLADNERMPEDEAWQVLESLFPCINRELIQLLLVGRGCTEFRAGLPPMLFLNGPTGSGKSAHVEIAAAIAGDTATAVPFKKDLDQLRQGMLTAKQAGGIVFFDEFFKNARINRVPDVDATETLLSFTPDSVSHQLYVGPVRMGDLPLLVWADTHIPQQVLTHEQIGRRMYYHRLSSAVHWEPAMQKIGEFKYLRTNSKPEVLEACNTILSAVIDRWFSGELCDFASCATALGFKRLRDGNAVEDKRALLRDLFNTVCACTDTQEVWVAKYGRGFKQMNLDGNNAIYQAMDMLWTMEEKNTRNCQAVEEADLKIAIPLTHSCNIEVRMVSRSIYAVRFVSEDGLKVNEELR